MYVNTQEQDNKWRDSGGTGHVSTWMDRWMDGWMDGWVVGWMDGWLDEFWHIFACAPFGS